MTSPIQVTVTGAADVRRSLAQLGRDLVDTDDATRQAAEVIRREVSRRAPRRTGRLASTVKATSTRTAAVVTATAPYTNAIHWGVGARPGQRGPHNITPHPFITEGLKTTEPQWMRAYIDHARDAARRASRGK